jgi:hypothetical protein
MASPGASEVMIPAEIMVVENLPLLATGKTDYPAMAESRLPQYVPRDNDRLSQATALRMNISASGGWRTYVAPLLQHQYNLFGDRRDQPPSAIPVRP